MSGCLVLGCVWMLLVLVPWGEAQHNVIRFAQTDIHEILDTHNELRRSIYNAANMRELSWNEGVALAASEWGTRCEYVSRPDNQWGQNMDYFRGNDYHKAPVELFRRSFRAWTNETMHYDYRRYQYCGSKNVCSYVQLIAADVQEMGCAIIKCPKLELRAPDGLQTNTKLLVCFYTPWVNILGSEVFIPDTRCSACPSGTSCVDNLCSARSGHRIRTLPIQSAPGVRIETISGPRSADVTTDKPQPVTSNNGRSRYREERRKERKERKEERHRERGGPNQELRERVPTYAYPGNNDTVVVYTPNNRVIPFPSRDDRRNIRRIEKFEQKNEADLDRKQEDIVHTLELIAANVTTVNESDVTGIKRKKRQVSTYDQRYIDWYDNALRLRRREYERYLRDYEDLMRQRQERRWHYEQELRRREQYNNHEQELRRREQYNNQVAELRRADGTDQYVQELRRRQHRLEEERRRYEALALTSNEGELTGEEQFFTISAHNILRREAGVKDLAWSSHLERWAKYVIRCETEYPGPITCHTNFGKAEPGEEVYNVVYRWGAEGDDLQRPLQYGCRTPYDKSLCNHNTIVRDRSLTQLACASKRCGTQRQLTCIYSSG